MHGPSLLQRAWRSRVCGSPVRRCPVTPVAAAAAVGVRVCTLVGRPAEAMGKVCAAPNGMTQTQWGTRYVKRTAGASSHQNMATGISATTNRRGDHRGWRSPVFDRLELSHVLILRASMTTLLLHIGFAETRWALGRGTLRSVRGLIRSGRRAGTVEADSGRRPGGWGAHDRGDDLPGTGRREDQRQSLQVPRHLPIAHRVIWEILLMKEAECSCWSRACGPA